jgi:hypothetical protein
MAGRNQDGRKLHPKSETRRRTGKWGLDGTFNRSLLRLSRGIGPSVPPVSGALPATSAFVGTNHNATPELRNGARRAEIHQDGQKEIGKSLLYIEVLWTLQARYFTSQGLHRAARK